MASSNKQGSEADPGFLRGGENPRKAKFSENYMKMKKIGLIDLYLSMQIRHWS